MLSRIYENQNLNKLEENVEYLKNFNKNSLFDKLYKNFHYLNSFSDQIAFTGHLIRENRVFY